MKLCSLFVGSWTFVLVLMLGLVTSPLMMATALLIKLTSPGPGSFQAGAMRSERPTIHHVQVSLHGG